MSSFNHNWIDQYVSNKNELVIFDIGAFDFKDSITFKNKFPIARVYAFEADESNIQKYARFAENAGVNVFNIAISNKNGETTFYNSETLYTGTWTSSGSILKPNTRANSNEGIHHPGLRFNTTGYSVKCKTLETFCNENNITPNVLHIDVQGAEKLVMSALGNYRPEIVFAETCEFDTYQSNTNIQEFDQLMNDLGYVINERFIYDTFYIKK